MNRILLLVFLAVGNDASLAFDRADVQGLRVVVEHIGDSMRVDSVPIRIQRAEGRDVDVLARRIEQRWKREGGAVRDMMHPGWTAVSRWRDGQSELIQWRRTGETAELLYSIVEVVSPPGAVTQAPIALPGRCEWGRVIEGAVSERRFAQHSAYCRLSPDALYDALLGSLAAQGWLVRHASRRALDVEREGLEGMLMLDAAGDGSSVTWLGLHRPGGRERW